MPHDVYGNEVEAGDSVIVRCRVNEVYPGHDFCNASLETDLPMYPGDSKTGLTVNTRQVELVSRADGGPLEFSAHLVR